MAGANYPPLLSSCPAYAHPAGHLLKPRRGSSTRSGALAEHSDDRFVAKQAAYSPLLVWKTILNPCLFVKGSLLIKPFFLGTSHGKFVRQNLGLPTENACRHGALLAARPTNATRKESGIRLEPAKKSSNQLSGPATQLTNTARCSPLATREKIRCRTGSKTREQGGLAKTRPPLCPTLAWLSSTWARSHCKAAANKL